ncbi:MAG: YqgE/AlgH family protein [Bacteroidota bacterium]
MATTIPLLKPGTILIAEPALRDSNFRRTVILLCEHSTDGSFGLILNRPTGHHLSDVLDMPLGFDAELYQGGPVQLDTLHFLHPYGRAIHGALPIIDGIWWGGDFDDTVGQIQSARLDPGRLRFFAGYAGWAPDQLDEEVIQDGWVVRPGHPRFVYDSDTQLWRELVMALGGEYRLLANFPDDPSLN